MIGGGVASALAEMYYDIRVSDSDASLLFWPTCLGRVVLDRQLLFLSWTIGHAEPDLTRWRWRRRANRSRIRGGSHRWSLKAPSAFGLGCSLYTSARKTRRTKVFSTVTGVHHVETKDQPMWNIKLSIYWLNVFASSIPLFTWCQMLDWSFLRKAMEYISFFFCTG